MYRIVAINVELDTYIYTASLGNLTTPEMLLHINSKASNHIRVKNNHNNNIGRDAIETSVMIIRLSLCPLSGSGPSTKRLRNNFFSWLKCTRKPNKFSIRAACLNWAGCPSQNPLCSRWTTSQDWSPSHIATRLWPWHYHESKCRHRELLYCICYYPYFSCSPGTSQVESNSIWMTSV